MRDSCPIHADVVLVAELEEFPASELGPVVGDDRVGHPEPVDDVGEELYGLFCLEICDWAHLNLLGKLINGDQQVGVWCPNQKPQGPGGLNR
jgi:hypothetical protein